MLGLFLTILHNYAHGYRVNIKEASVQKLGSVCRRVYRIFSHAYFHHRSTYDEFEVNKSKITYTIYIMLH
jgi:hypothetical protein